MKVADIGIDMEPERGTADSGDLEAGMDYSTAHGEMDFTVPLFDAFVRRAMPVFPAPQPETALRLPKDSSGV